MALITDYATLVTTITDYLARSDLSSYVPNFLQNCQGKIYRSLRLRAMETALSGTITGGVLAVPADYLELKYAYLTTSPSTFLERTTPELIYTKWRLRSASGRPLEIAREADNFIFGPYPDSSTYTLAGIYYKQLTLLSASNTTNWFTTNAPEVMLYGALLEAQPFLMNDKRMPTWQMLYDQALETVKRADRRENHSGSTLATKVG
jgi:hypothetical protein